METAIVIGSMTSDLSDLKRKLERFFEESDENARVDLSDKQLSIYADSGRIYIDAPVKCEELNPADFGPEVRARIEREPSAVATLMDYNDLEFTRQVLALLADGPNALVDDGLGCVLAGDQFASKHRKPVQGW